ncbi:FadR/GntR family transcriptional regulator [Ferviditalea candida]|uniref:FadR/GntR family transcriptional regulator n=1 Tax=Ferviditalea candida TaxID=3108399 RepID=A0ABU5ZH32_9BACL|nr:FadR/GntR family transcriptional regulator [Paenibacillaceae bacterium T2]
MFKSINEEKKTLTKKVVDHVRELIITEQLKPGDKLPAERDLVDMMDVSRPTIREAFKILSAMGFIKIRPGHGVFVSDYNDRIDNLAAFLFVQSDTIHELFEVRKIIETETASWAAKRGTADFLEQIHAQTNEIYKKVVVDKEFESVEEKERFLSESDQAFHLSIAEAAGNEVLLRVMNNLIDLLRETRMRSMKVPGRVEQSLKEHIWIADALVARKPELARDRMFNHLSSVEMDLAKELEENH